MLLLKATKLQDCLIVFPLLPLGRFLLSEGLARALVSSSAKQAQYENQDHGSDKCDHDGLQIDA